jgi:hypothetical protein
MAYTSNVSSIVRLQVKRLHQVGQADQMLRTVALAVLPEVKKRVHVNGKASDGSQIGTYSKSYMAVRTGAFQNAKRSIKGKNKGKLKDAGTFTDRVIRLDKKTGVFSGEEKEGSARPKYNRTADTKVIGSLTRQMENDLSVVAAGRGYGIGYLNPYNYDKSQWLEMTYKKDIWELTKEELELAKKVAEDFVHNILNGN